MRLYEFDKNTLSERLKIIEVKMKKSLMDTKYFINHFKEVSNDREFNEKRNNFKRK